jgi:rhomboid protease GluP
MSTQSPDVGPEEAPSSPRLRLRLPMYPVRLTYALIVVNVLVFVPTLLFGSTVYDLGGLVPGLVLERGQLWRLITAGFIHGDVMHIGFNMYALYIFGRQIERLLGPRRFVLIYGLALLGGNVAVVLLNPLNSLTVGASGAILGLLGALVAYFWRYQETMLGARAHLSNLVTTAAINLGLGLLPRVSLWGHLGGTLAGLASGWILVPRYRPVYGLATPQMEIVERQSREWTGTAGVFLACVLILTAALWLR